MAEAPNNIKRYEPAFMLGFPLPVSLLDTTGATTGQVPQFNGSTVVWGNGGVAYVQPGNTNLTCGSNNLLQYGNFLLGTSSTIIVTSPSVQTLTENTAVFLKNTVGNPTTGNSEFTLTVYYQINQV